MGIYWFHIIPTNWIGSFAHPSHSFARNKITSQAAKDYFLMDYHRLTMLMKPLKNYELGTTKL
jgi:hypothetical protein